MVRIEVFKQFTNFTYLLEVDEEKGEDDQRKGILIIDQVYIRAAP